MVSLFVPYGKGLRGKNVLLLFWLTIKRRKWRQPNCAKALGAGVRV